MYITYISGDQVAIGAVTYSFLFAVHDMLPWLNF